VESLFLLADHHEKRHKMTEEELTWTRLEQLGLAITQRQEPAAGWGYTWRGRKWQGPYETPIAALEAAFSRAIDSLILSGLCPFRTGECPLLRPPPLSHFEAELGPDEEEEYSPWWHDEDQEG
jgi:hypothetical protein